MRDTKCALTLWQDLFCNGLPRKKHVSSTLISDDSPLIVVVMSTSLIFNFVLRKVRQQISKATCGTVASSSPLHFRTTADIPLAPAALLFFSILMACFTSLSLT